MRLYKTFWGLTIDLDHVQAISDARFIDRMGYGGYFAGFDIHFILQDKPLSYLTDHYCKNDYYRYVAPGDRPQNGYHEIKMANHQWVKVSHVKDQSEILMVVVLQMKVNRLIEEWKTWTPPFKIHPGAFKYQPYWNDNEDNTDVRSPGPYRV